MLMKLKRIFAGIMSAAIALSFFGCASTTETADTQGESGTSHQAEDTSWTDVQEAGKIVIGVDDQFPPMGFRDDSGEIVGFDIDLANAVCEKLGVQAEIKPIDWSAKEAELAAGSIDLIWNGYTVTDERREKVLFTDPYLANSQIIVTKEGYGVESKNDLTGVEVGVQAQSSALDAINADELGAEISANLREYDTNVTAMLDLDAGNVKAVVMDEVVANYYISQHPGSYVILDENFGSEEYAVGIRLGSEALKDRISTAINELKADGTAAEISTKWFGEDKLL